MLAKNFYAEEMLKCGAKVIGKGTLDAPKLSAGGSGGGVQGIEEEDDDDKILYYHCHQCYLFLMPQK